MDQKILNRLEALLDQSEKSAEQHELHFAHFYSDGEESATPIRISRTREVTGNAQSEPNLRSLVEPDLEVLFERHVKVFGRRHTLLDWFDRLDSSRIVIEHGEKIEIAKEKGSGQFTIRLTGAMVEALSPARLAREYMQALSSSNAAEIEPVSELMTAQRGHAFGMIKECPELVREFGAALNQEPSNDLACEHSVLSFLTAMQSVMIFGHRVTAWATRGKLLASLELAEAENRDDGEMQGKTVLLRLPGHMHATKPSGKRSSNRSPGDSVRQSRRESARCVASWKPFGSSNDEEVLSVIEALQEHFPKNYLAEERKQLTLWMMRLAMDLRQQVHEGQPLSFWLVAGDQTTVVDSPLFRLRTMRDLNDLGVHVPPAKDETHGRSSEPLQKAVKAIAKGNYSWFEGGRYALFWDATFAQRAPVGLLEVQDSTWTRFEAVASRRANHPNEPRASLMPALIIVSVDYWTARLLIGSELVASIPKNSDHWHLAKSGARQQSLIRLMQSANVLSIGERSTLARVLSRVAEEPFRGCIVVLRDQGDGVEDVQMGKVWKPSDDLTLDATHEDDLVVLVSTDGATIIELNNNEKSVLRGFRHVLRSRTDVAPLLDYPEILDGAGSRRWSGALAALDPAVRVVFVVSQDGDIHVWRKNEGALAAYVMRANEETLTPVGQAPASASTAKG